MMNRWPCFRGTGGRVTFVSADYRVVRIKLPLSLRTRNYVGTMYGGSMYGSVDPIYMLMLIKNLGPRYLVWDKSATVRFRKPGRTTLSAEFVLNQAELDAIRAELHEHPKIDRTYTIDLLDAQGDICASIEKVVNIRPKADS
jgi:hypothetical protein